MKVSVAVSILILAIGIGLGWQNHQRLASAASAHTKLRTAAARSGMMIGSGDVARVTKLEREDSTKQAKLSALKIIELEKAMDVLPEKENLVLLQKLSRDYWALKLSMNAAGFISLITMAKADESLSNESRQRLIFTSLTNLAIDHPQAVLEMISTTPDLVASEDLSKYNVSFALGRWARESPSAALAWFKENKERFPDSNSADKIIIGTATRDPKVAFSLIRELSVKDESKAVRSIVNTAVSPEEKTAVCLAFRNHLATLDSGVECEKIKSAGFRELAENLTRGDFASASQWLASVNFTPDELEALADGVYKPRVSAVSGRWMEWLGMNLPKAKYEKRVEQMMARWASNDFRAAGNWLGSTPASPVKTLATQSYAEAISSYNPETAAQWALTLPSGQDREKTLRHIHRNWPKDAPEAAAAFAKEHGIQSSDPP